MKKECRTFLLVIFIVLFSFFLLACAQQQMPISQESVEMASETVPAPVLETSPIETNNLTVNQPAIQETKVQELKCSRKFSPQFNAGSYYQDALFDAHFHMPPAFEDEHEESPLFFPKGFRVPVLGKEITLNEILCTFDKEKVIGAITFNTWEYEKQEQSIQNLADMKKQLPAGVHLFLMPAELEAKELDEAISSHKGVFDGFGEIVFYDPDREGATPDDRISLEINNIAEKHKFIVMFHPDSGQETNVENAL
ncbi:MAG: hypothetical protein AABX31_03795, partial [Nanoarchaeota archaeon]